MAGSVESSSSDSVSKTIRSAIISNWVGARPQCVHQGRAGRLLLSRRLLGGSSCGQLLANFFGGYLGDNTEGWVLLVQPAKSGWDDGSPQSVSYEEPLRNTEVNR